MCENYLISAHENDILMILENPEKEKHFSVYINFLELFESDTNLGNALLTDPEKSLKNWNEAVFTVQSNLLKEVDKKCTIKNNVNCRIYSLPPWPHVCRTIFPGNDDTEKFLQVTGTVVRMSARKLLEYQRQYICTKCKYPITVEANYDKLNIIKAPKKCTNPEGCTGKNIVAFGELDPYNCKDYQEIKIQEDLTKMGVGTVPNHMFVTLEDDLVNICKPGENITITGIVKRRWSEFDKGVKMTVDIVLKANHVQVNNCNGLSIAVSDDLKQFFDNYWKKYRRDPLVGRNIIVKSISPEIYGRELVKLAMAMVLAGGSSNEEDSISTGIDRRSESHLLLVGDPGTGKSQMLKFASRIVPRSVLTTGVGSTAAGLTVTALMEKGEWQLEAGALVMADGGICCIDEFNSMKEHDRTSIHEAMEQQTISVAKAGIVCKLKTRCSILAACNPKGNIDPSQPLCVNVAMSSPLLSRFDLILLLRDVVNEETDKKLAEFLLNIDVSERSDENEVWGLEKLQAYFAVIKKNCPKLTNEAETILSNYYQLQRKFGSRNKSRTTVRLLESLIRLSQGHAKLIYHSEVEVIDTIFAIILVDAALDYDSSVFNLKIDYASFFEEPETQYWNLLETILGKLNLDYIYQREVEKMGVNIVDIRKGSQNSDGQKMSDTSSKLGESMIISPHLLISSTQNQINHKEETGHTNANQSKLLFNREKILSQSISEIREVSPPKGPKLLFSQRALSQKLNESSRDHLGIHFSQSNSATSEKTSPQKVPNPLFSQKRFNEKSVENSMGNPEDNFSKISSEITGTGVQKRPKLLFSQKILSQKSVEESSASNNSISQVAGQVYSNIKSGVFEDSNRNDDSGNISQDSSPFSIFQNRNISLKRNQSVLHAEPGTSYKEKKDLQKVDLKKDLTKNRMETKKKNTFLKPVKSSHIMDMDLDGFFDNMMPNTLNMPLKNIFDKSKREESGFGSQSTSGKNSETQDSTLKEINGDRNKIAAKVSSDCSVKEQNKRNKTSKSKKCEKVELINEADFLKLLPSVNDDFIKYGLDIDWNMQDDSDQDKEKDEEDTNKKTSYKKTNVNKNEGKNLVENTVETKKVCKFSGLFSEFEYEPKEQKDHCREKCSEENNDKTVPKDTKNNKFIESGQIKENTARKKEDNELNMVLSSQVENNLSKRFKYENKEGKKESNSTTISELKNPNFKRISSINFAALDEEIRSFEFDGNIGSSFKRKFSSCSSKNSFNDGDKSKQTCDIGQNGVKAGDKCLSTNSFQKDVESESCRDNPPSLESFFGDIDDFNVDSIHLGNKNKGVNVQGPKHELFDLTQNSRKQFIRNKFTFKKLDIKKMPSGNIPNE